MFSSVRNMPYLIYKFLHFSLMILKCAYRQYHNIFTHSSWIIKRLSAFRHRSITHVTAFSLKFSICSMGLLLFSHSHTLLICLHALPLAIWESVSLFWKLSYHVILLLVPICSNMRGNLKSDGFQMEFGGVKLSFLQIRQWACHTVLCYFETVLRWPFITQTFLSYRLLARQIIAPTGKAERWGRFIQTVCRWS